MSVDKPAHYATYRGDCTHMLGQSVGPTTYGAWLVAVTVHYNAATDRTRVGFAYGGRPTS